MIVVSFPLFLRVGSVWSFALLVGFFHGVGPIARGAEKTKTSFNLPADTLEKSVKRFAAQSGLEVLIPGDAVAEVRTRTVRGEMTSRQALDAMLAGTGLTILQDPRTGAFAVRKEPTGPNGQRATPEIKSDRPKIKKKVMNRETPTKL